MYNVTLYQKQQIKVINDIESKVKNNSLDFSTVKPVKDFASDKRMSLTSVHFPHIKLLNQIQSEIIKPLKEVQSEHYYYTNKSLHLTIKNIKVIADPPNYDQEDIKKVKQVFNQVIPKHKKFKVYFYRLLLFPNKLALIGTADAELDKIVLELDEKLKQAAVPDDKKYSNSKYFFSNMTLVRFNSPVSEKFKAKVVELSEQINFEPYTINSVSLVEANASMVRRRLIKTWKLA